MLKSLLKFMGIILAIILITTAIILLIEHLGAEIPLSYKFYPYILIAVIMIIGQSRITKNNNIKSTSLIYLLRIFVAIPIAFIFYCLLALLGIINLGEHLYLILVVIISAYLIDII